MRVFRLWDRCSSVRIVRHTYRKLRLLIFFCFACVMIERFEENAAMYHWPGIKGADIVSFSLPSLPFFLDGLVSLTCHDREHSLQEKYLCHGKPQR